MPADQTVDVAVATMLPAEYAAQAGALHRCDCDAHERGTQGFEPREQCGRRCDVGDWLATERDPSDHFQLVQPSRVEPRPVARKGAVAARALVALHAQRQGSLQIGWQQVGGAEAAWLQIGWQ